MDSHLNRHVVGWSLGKTFLQTNLEVNFVILREVTRLNYTPNLEIVMSYP